MKPIYILLAVGIIVMLDYLVAMKRLLAGYRKHHSLIELSPPVVKLYLKMLVYTVLTSMGIVSTVLVLSEFFNK